MASMRWRNTAAGDDNPYQVKKRIQRLDEAKDTLTNDLATAKAGKVNAALYLSRFAYNEPLADSLDALVEKAMFVESKSRSKSDD